MWKNQTRTHQISPFSLIKIPKLQSAAISDEVIQNFTGLNNSILKLYKCTLLHLSIIISNCREIARIELQIFHLTPPKIAFELEWKSFVG
jgi:hypothetical protein